VPDQAVSADAWHTPQAGAYFLGIDTGGTFTDAVLLDARREVVAAAKSLTTRFDLGLGIAASLAQLPPPLLDRVSLVSLSTTLTTNSVVEGRGAPVCALLAGYDDGQLKASKLVDLLGADAVVQLAGGHDAMGNPTHELDEAAARAAIVAQAPRVSAFAISATFSVRNPAHEIQLRAWVRELTHRPVSCGHELSSNLGAPRRAMTAALNARMIPYVHTLIESVQATLAARGIGAPLMVVRGDGSVVNAASALQQPVTTVLSGPAASVIGACALSGRRRAIVADMGGTTTDIAVVRDGQPALAGDGALIGDWRPMVEAVKVLAVGLGGDSEVRFGGGQGIRIGPRRVIPLSLLVHEHPALIEVLRRQVNETPHAAQARFALRWQADDVALARLAADEQAAWQRLGVGPIDVERANRDERALARSLARLERKGLVIYSGMTPTDAAHVLGLSSHWSREAAELGAIVWARQMRHLYGCGQWVLGDAVAPCAQIMATVVEAIRVKLIEAGLNDADRLQNRQADAIARLIGDLAAPQPGGAAFELRFAHDMPLVAVGAPAASYYPAVARALGLELVLPAHGEVANAVGAALGKVAQRVHMTVTQAARGVYRVFAPEGPEQFAELALALARCRELATQAARTLALEAGAAQVQVECTQRDNRVSDDIDGDVFFEATVTATARGVPRTRLVPAL
jgi:N-methylhydantoinase A/oxoprolinase/acetone carboxylase beta subunit